MAGSRGNGEGSIYQRTYDGRRLGVVTVGQDGTGRVVRKAVSVKTRAEVVRKLKKLQRDLDDGLPTSDTKMTVGQLLTATVQLAKSLPGSCSVIRKDFAESLIGIHLGRKWESTPVCICNSEGKGYELDPVDLGIGRLTNPHRKNEVPNDETNT